MKPYYDGDGITIYHGDCREILPLLPKVDLVLTDPPYGMERFKTDGKNYLESVGPALQLTWGCLRESGSMFAFASTAEVVNVANALNQPLKRLLWMYKPADCTYPFCRMASEVRSHPVVRQGQQIKSLRSAAVQA